MAVAVLVAAGSRGADIAPDHRWFVGVLFALLVCSEIRPMQWHPRGGEFTASWGFAGALALVAEPVVGLAAIALASVIGDLVSRKRLDRIAFNSASLVLSLGAGVGVLHLAGAPDFVVAGAIPWWYLGLTVSFAITVYVTNLALMATVIHLDRGVTVRSILEIAVPQSISDDLLLLAMSPVFAIVGLRSLPMLVLPLLAVVAIHRSARQAADSRVRATRDELTGLVHRDEFVDALAAAIPAGTVVVMLDLDGFKGINDRLGHAAGDRTLQIVAQRLSASVRPTDVVARVGGDEFAVVIEQTSGVEAQAAVERIRAAIRAPMEVDGVPLPLEVSLGVAESPIDGTDVETLLDRADTRMLTNKIGRREPNATIVPSFSSRLSLLRDLRAAITDDTLGVAFQPQIDLRTGQTVGFESLVRWRRDGKDVSPSEFVAAAEHTELIGPLTDHVLHRSLETCARWWGEGHEVPVSVNISSRSLIDPRFMDVVRSSLLDAGLPGRALEVEFTESALLVDVAVAAETIFELRDEGVSLAIDDFGTGFSSFDHLRSLPVRRLKIDRSFVGGRDRVADPRFLGPIITLAHNLGVSVVAEGVEDTATERVLADLGCDAGQGWLFSRPLSADDSVRWLSDTPADAAFG
ncbi:putative bifunctional diguanylate cyclase/phosphodiesterase [Actinospongicola halichondriae]|uniref:putative bifunctional diguanylate cyclase/phosphodiesterase n=1 Tax=Actinospongicola halichondriae TaxID=3236844 RepID=UPI003D587EA6